MQLRECLSKSCSGFPIVSRRRAVQAAASLRTAERTIFELPESLDEKEKGPDSCFGRIYRVTKGDARALVGPTLSAKYRMAPDNRQTVVSITNCWTYEQTHFNAERSRKPQTFPTNAVVVDPTGGGGGNCDFCNATELTAQDSFGRVERPHAISGSNLFKYGEPFHGLAVFKHHDPLNWNTEQLADLLAVSASWFEAAQEAYAASHKQGLQDAETGGQSSEEMEATGERWQTYWLCQHPGLKLPKKHTLQVTSRACRMQGDPVRKRRQQVRGGRPTGCVGNLV
ncbi:hypothetical protein DUNSADRAFT_14553 [Dunaliella salina]|uniref:Encoded protein n=1 Tax=Dunaliella salina TaxID=3046 RepID=A0ABQ7G775_DUNSA|nr:hypothetical protein DUNSADRAFT_14553 [Dunaliella salina]|eukprot:KAF5830456.1 hypothetical protein DUNSADRAFT_14553 [Dunaliella salina]